MTQVSYPFRHRADRYIFTSIGKKKIIKAVDFTPTSIKNLYSLSFGDLLPDGLIDDAANSNNGDIVKVLATVVQIAKDFTTQYPDIKLVFTGSTEERTKLYTRILNMYYKDFSRDFKITAFIRSSDFYEEVNFELNATIVYFAFFIKRID
ncbi:MAG TPA: hypothetical protein VK563_03870 [Puia sp.]|nr:hypothetical protein [Puia sp.]